RTWLSHHMADTPTWPNSLAQTVTTIDLHRLGAIDQLGVSCSTGRAPRGRAASTTGLGAKEPHEPLCGAAREVPNARACSGLARRASDELQRVLEDVEGPGIGDVQA